MSDPKKPIGDERSVTHTKNTQPPPARDRSKPFDSKAPKADKAQREIRTG